MHLRPYAELFYAWMTLNCSECEASGHSLVDVSIILVSGQSDVFCAKEVRYALLSDDATGCKDDVVSQQR